MMIEIVPKPAITGKFEELIIFIEAQTKNKEFQPKTSYYKT